MNVLQSPFSLLPLFGRAWMEEYYPSLRRRGAFFPQLMDFTFKKQLIPG